jgi:4-coumarate--CoA ligase
MKVYIDAYDASNSISAVQAKVLIRQLIAGLKHAGIQKGDTVLVHAFNSIYYPILVLGIIGCGAIYTGSNPAYTAYEVRWSTMPQLSNTDICSAWTRLPKLCT